MTKKIARRGKLPYSDLMKRDGMDHEKMMKKMESGGEGGGKKKPKKSKRY